jgi:hypothetical protein
MKRGPGDLPLFAQRYRLKRIAKPLSGMATHLDEYQCVSILRDQVDFSHGATVVARDNCVSLPL